MPSTQSKTSAVLEGVNYLPILQACVPLGLATTPQIIQASGLTREVVNGTLRKLLAARDEQERPFLREAPLTRIYAGNKGRPPALYLLEAAGANLLRQAGGAGNVRPCNLKDPLALAHAVCLRDVYFKAQADERAPRAERELHFGDDNIRPDVLVALNGGAKGIFEIEQEAAPPTLERLLDKVRRLAVFFAAPESRGMSPDIRILFNVSAGDEAATHRIWEKALAAIAAEQPEQRLPCRFWALSLMKFLNRPEWDALDSFENLFNPALLESFRAPALTTPDEVPGSRLTLPPELARVRVANSVTDLTILRAYYSVFQGELAAQAELGADSHSFFRLTDWIYCASHYPGSPTLERAQLPLASLFLLRQYLESPLHPDLKLALEKGIQDVQHSYYRGNVVIRDRLTHLAWDVFLRYHGFARGGPLKVFAAMPDFDDGRSDFYFRVHIANPDLLIGPDGLLGRGAVDLAEEALAWVLESLFIYAEELGLSKSNGKPKAEL